MNQNSIFRDFLFELDKFANLMTQGIYSAKRDAYTRASADEKPNIYNLPVSINPAVLNNWVERITKFNNTIENDPRINAIAKTPANAQLIKRYYEKISSNLVNIDYRNFPDFKTEVTNQFDRFNSIMFNAPEGSFTYPEPLYGPPNIDDTAGEFSHPEPGLETGHASSLKQKAALAANALRKTIDKVTAPNTRSIPKKHPGWDTGQGYYNEDGKWVPGYGNWNP